MTREDFKNFCESIDALDFKIENFGEHHKSYMRLLDQCIKDPSLTPPFAKLEMVGKSHVSKRVIIKGDPKEISRKIIPLYRLVPSPVVHTQLTTQTTH